MFLLQTERFINYLAVNTINMEEDILLENSKRFLRSAELVYNSKDFTSATILYFKALFSVLDLMILRGTGKMPKDHSERFRILESKYPKLYEELDRLYPLYRDSYSMTISK